MSILELYTRLVSNKLRCASFLEKVEATMTMIEVLFRYSIKHYRPIFIGFSGGRDSLTLILLTIELLKDKRELLKELSKEDLLHVFYIKVSGNTHRVNEEHVIEIMNEFLTRLNLSSKCFHIISRDIVENLAHAERLQKSKYVAILRGNNTKISIAEIVESANVDSRRCRNCPMLYF